MATFSYQARDETGRRVTGVLEAESQGALAERLRKMGYLTTRIEEAVGAPSGAKRSLWQSPVPQEELLLAVVELANLIEAGIPLMSALQTVASQATHGTLKGALQAATREIEAGAPFSEALTHHPQIFPNLMVSMVAAGEAGGQMDLALSRFAGFLEKDLELTRQVKGALTYPALLLVVSTLLMLLVVTFVVPQFASLFLKAGLTLPLPTQILVGIGETFQQRWMVGVLMGGLGMMGIAVAGRQPRIRLKLHGLVLKIPVIGSAIHHTVVARFSRTLATLVGGGIPILSALDTAQGVAGNQVIAEEIKRVRSAVEGGERMAETLTVGKVFHPDAIQMIRAGEESGRLEVMLEKVAQFYEMRVNFRLKQLTTLLEPLLLIVMGGLVAFIMASLLLPMFDMVKVLQHGGL